MTDPQPCCRHLEQRNWLIEELAQIAAPLGWATDGTVHSALHNLKGYLQMVGEEAETERRHLAEERDEHRAQVEEYDALLKRMSDLLTRTANAIKGPPGPLMSHSWSDLPEVIEKRLKQRELERY